MSLLSKMYFLTTVYKTLCLGGVTAFTVLLCASQGGAVQGAAVAMRTVASGQDAVQGTLLAQRRGSYRPPSGSRIPRGDHSGGGVRGCGEEIVAIAPRLSGIGQTVSTHPTLVWYNAGETPLPLEVHLYRYIADDEMETVFIRSVGDSKKGYMAYTLPENESGLAADETYLWQVVLYCDSDREEVGMWTAADIELVPTAPVVDSSMPLGAAESYAESGIWYDAIAEVYNATSVEAKDFRTSLLLDLADLEAAVELDRMTESSVEGEETPSGKISNQLREIADM